MTERVLDGRTAIVTCGGVAAGRTYARALAAAGARVVVADPVPDAAQDVVERIVAAGGEALSVEIDLADEASYVVVTERALAAFGGIDVVVNNPNRYGATRFTPLAELTIEHWDATMAVMVRGVMLMCKAALPALTESPHAAIVNHTSSAAYGVRNWLDYGTARGAVIAMTKSLAKELAPMGIRVNALSVGSSAIEAIALGVVADEAQMTGTPEFQAQLIPRLATDDDLAGPVVFLAGDASRYLTGQTVECDGGKVLLG